ncbi:MAG: diacylglycerol kinase [Chromatiales bacterium]|jgi:diacylglycerol kinase (ATP)
MAKPGNTGIKRIIAAAGFSMRGLRAAWKHEAAFRQELMLAVVMLPLAFWLGQTVVEQALLITTLFIVVITEVLNSSIEAVVDRISDEQHKLAGRAKDMGSAAVFLSLLLVGVVWGLMLWQRFMG